MVLPLVPPQLRMARAAPVAPVAADRQILHEAIAPRVGHAPEERRIECNGCGRHRETCRSITPGLTSPPDLVQPEARRVDQPPPDLRRPEVSCGPEQAREREVHVAIAYDSPEVSGSTAANVASVTAASVPTGMGGAAIPATSFPKAVTRPNA